MAQRGDELYAVLTRPPAAARTFHPARVLVLLGTFVALLVALAGTFSGASGGASSLAAAFPALVGVAEKTHEKGAPDNYANALDSPNMLDVKRQDVVRAAVFTFARMNQDRILCDKDEYAGFAIRSASDQVPSASHAAVRPPPREPSGSGVQGFFGGYTLCNP